jgi:diguanylate cyclase (GGDEF)-like protein
MDTAAGPSALVEPRPLPLLTSLRWFIATTVAVAVIGLVIMVSLVGWSPIGSTIGEPALWGIFGLVVLADLYALVPWLRDIQGRWRIHWSAALSLALLIGFGPATVLLFPLIGLVAISSLGAKGGAWWRRMFNISLVVIEGLVGAVVVWAVWGTADRAADPTAAQLLAGGLLVAAVWEVVNVTMIAGAQTFAGMSAFWPAIRSGGRKTVMWLVALCTAPLTAEIALVAPAMLPIMVLVILAMHHNVAAVTRRKDEARTDTLTGLANRTAAMELLTRRLDNQDRREVAVTLLLIDLDGFKAVNDTHGHHAGDEVLVEVGQRIVAAAPPETLVARLGGDEFVIIGGEVPDPAALTTIIDAEVIRPVRIGSLSVSVSCSIGWAIGLPGTDPMDLFRLVDRNLYRFKHGRTRPDIRQNLSQ